MHEIMSASRQFPSTVSSQQHDAFFVFHFAVISTLRHYEFGASWSHGRFLIENLTRHSLSMQETANLDAGQHRQGNT
jgi:hypothetical protein